MMKLAIIYRTDEYIDYNRPNIREQLEDIFDDESNCILDKFTTDETMYEIIHRELGNPKTVVTACNIW